MENGMDVEEEKEPGAAAEFVPEDASTDKAKTHTGAASRDPFTPVIRLTTPNSDSTSTTLPLYDAEHEAKFENCGDNTLDQQSKQRVQFDEALRMHSYGGSQYVGRVVDKHVERKAMVRREREDEEQEARGGSG